VGDDELVADVVIVPVGVVGVLGVGDVVGPPVAVAT
jgi:hypothetical protein